MAIKLTPEQIESKILSEQYHHFKNTTLTVCCLTMLNGHTVTGESVCSDPSEFCSIRGKELARKAAVEKVWELEIYFARG